MNYGAIINRPRPSANDSTMQARSTRFGKSELYANETHLTIASRVVRCLIATLRAVTVTLVRGPIRTLAA